MFVLQADDIALAVKLIDAQFPPYEQVIPKDHEKAITVAAPGVHRRAPPRAADVVGDPRREGRRSRRASCPSTSDNPDLGEAKEEIEADYNGDADRDWLQPAVLRRAARPDGDDQVRLELGGELDPGVSGRPTAATTSASSCRCASEPHRPYARAGPASESLAREGTRAALQTCARRGGATSSPATRVNVCSFGDNGQGKTNLLEAVYAWRRCARSAPATPTS